MNGLERDLCYQQAAKNKDVDEALLPLRQFLLGELSLSWRDLATRLHDLARVFSPPNRNETTPTPCAPVARLTLETLECLLADEEIAALFEPDKADPDGVVPAIEDAVATLCKEYARKLTGRANDSTESTTTALADLFSRLLDIWYARGDHGKRIVLRAVTELAEFYTKPTIRGRFPEFSDAVVQTLEARAEGAGQITVAQQNLFRAHLGFWSALVGVVRNDPVNRGYLQGTLCFRCDRLAALMGRLRMEQFGDAIGQFERIMLGLAKEPDQSPPVLNRGLLNDSTHPEYRAQLSATYQHLANWFRAVEKRYAPRLRRMLALLGPFLQGRPPRPGRRDVSQARAQTVEKDGAPAALLQLLDVSEDEKDTVRVAMPQTHGEFVRSSKNIELVLLLPPGFQFPDGAVPVWAQFVRPCAPGEGRECEGEQFVLKLNPEWVANTKVWSEFVETQPRL